MPDPDPRAREAAVSGGSSVRRRPSAGSSSAATPATVSTPETEAGPAARLAQLLDEAEALAAPVLIRDDEEAIHDLRVGLRRVRVLCRELAEREPAEAIRYGELRAGATGLFRALAGLRDLDIVGKELLALGAGGDRKEGMERGLPPALAAWLEAERGRLRLGLSHAITFFGDEVARYRTGTSGRGFDGSRPPRTRVGRTGLRKPARRLLRALARARRDPTPERLHRLRIRGKALRYTIEARFQGAGGSQADLPHLESSLKKLQDALGAVQDAAMLVGRLDGLGLAGEVPPEAVGPARVTAARELERRRSAFLADLDSGGYDNLLIEVKKVAAKQGGGTKGESGDADQVPLEEIPGIGPAKARRLAEAGLASPDALKSASVEDLAAVKTIGPHQAKLIKEFVDGGPNGSAGGEAVEAELDGKRFERAQAVLALSATVSDYARTLAEELSRHEEGDSVRAGRQAERLADRMEELPELVTQLASKKLKSLRAELRETEGLLAKVLDLDASSLKMNKLRKALKAHRKAIQAYLS